MGNSICKKFSTQDRIEDIERALTEIAAQVKAAGSDMTTDQQKMVNTAIETLESARTRTWHGKEYSSTIETISQDMPMTDARILMQGLAFSIHEAI